MWCGSSDRWLCAVVLVIGGCVLCAGADQCRTVHDVTRGGGVLDP